MMCLRKCMSVFALLSLIVCPSFALHGESARLIRELTSVPEKAFTKPTIVERTLSNGMRCLFIEDHLLPTIRLKLSWPGGAAFDPAKTVGLHAALAYMLSNGGTVSRSPEEIDRLRDEHAMSMGVSQGRELVSAEYRSLISERELGLELFFEMLYAPRYDSDRLALTKSQMLETLRRRNDVPAKVATRIFRKMLYGENNPWASSTTPAMVQAINRSQMESVHQWWMNPERMMCAAVGDFQAEDLVQQLESEMAKYEMPSGALPALPAAPIERRPGIWLLDRPGAPQSSIYAGVRTVNRMSPDVPVLAIIDREFGASAAFDSWMKRAIRVEAGLAYEAWSALLFGPPTVPGQFSAHTKTQTATTGETVQILQRLLRELYAGERFTEESIAIAKKAILEKRIFQYEDPYDYLTSMMSYIMVGLPANYMELYPDKIRAVTLPDVRRVAKHYLHDEAMTLLVVGDAAQIKPQLEQLGPVQIYELGDH